MMPISRTTQATLRCPEDGQLFTAEVWSIVDAAERPDLADALLDGELNMVSCNGGAPFAAPVPLLFHDPARRRVYFAAPPDAEEHAVREQAQGLLEQLLAVLPDEQHLAYLGDLQIEGDLAGLRRAVSRTRRRAAGGTPSAPPAKIAGLPPIPGLVRGADLAGSGVGPTFAASAAEGTTDQGLRTKDQGPRTKDQGPKQAVPDVEKGPRTTDHGPRTTDHGPKLADGGPKLAPSADEGSKARSERSQKDQGPKQTSSRADRRPPTVDADAALTADAAPTDVRRPSSDAPPTSDVRPPASGIRRPTDAPPTSDVRPSTSVDEPPVNADDILEQLQDLLTCETIEEFQHYARNHPALLTDAASEALTELAGLAQSQGDREIAQAMRAARQALLDLRHGVDVPSASVAVPPSTPQTMQLDYAAYHELMQSESSAALLDLCRDYPALLETWVDEALVARIDAAVEAGAERLALEIEERRAALADVRAEQLSSDALISAARALLAANDDDTLADTIGMYPALLTEAGQDALLAVPAVGDTDADAHAEVVQSLAAMLRHVRAELDGQ